MRQFVLQAIETPAQPLAIGRIGRSRQGLGHAFGLEPQRDQVVQRTLGLFPQCTTRREFRLLLEVFKPGRGVQFDFARIGLQLPGENLQ